MGSEQAHLHSKLPTRHEADTCRVFSWGKSLGLAVVAAVNGRGEVMVARDMQRNDGRDVGLMVRSGHLTPSPGIVPQLIDAWLKTLTTRYSFALATSLADVCVLCFHNMLTCHPPPRFLACFKILPHTELIQRRSEILQKPARVLQEAWHSLPKQRILDFSSSNLEF